MKAPHELARRHPAVRAALRIFRGAEVKYVRVRIEAGGRDVTCTLQKHGGRNGSGAESK